jgi:hypothetical protein
MRKIDFNFVLFGFVIFIFVVGCGHVSRLKPDDLPKLYPVVLTFTQDNSPLDGATVTLWSTEPDSKWAVGGITDANGKVKITTNGFYIGAPEGTYKIVIDKIYRDQTENAKTNGKLLQAVDEKYLNTNNSPLEIEITKKGKNNQSFELGKPANIIINEDE